MAQIDTSLILADGTGTSVLDALNEQFGAFQSCSSGPVEPTLTTEGMLWFDTVSNRLNIRNIDNTAWIIFPIDFDTGQIIGASTGGSSGSSGSVDTGDVVTVVGDVSGSGVFDESGNVAVDTAISLPSIVNLDGGAPGSTYLASTGGPYGAVGNNVIPDGGLTGQVLTKLTDISFDVGWVNSQTTIPDITSEYCPGYTYAFIDSDEWRIAGFDVTKLFSVGRRLKFINNAIITYGTITVSTFTGGNTDMTMSMEDAATLNISISQVCLTTGIAGWSPIAANPFTSTAINDICVGDISGTTYLFAVGDIGKCGVSSNGGITWTMLSTGTTEHLNVCTYDSTNEQFWGGGQAGVVIDTTNATSITLDTTSIPALTGLVDYNINGFAYSSTEDGLILNYHRLSTTWTTASSTDQGGTWTPQASLGNIAPRAKTLKAVVVVGGATGLAIYSFIPGNTALKLLSTGITDTAFSNGDSVSPNTPSAMSFFDDGSSAVRIIGTNSGAIYGASQWVGIDNVTFSNPINDFAYASIHDRLVLVGDNQQIGYWDEADKGVADAWTSVENGFAPLANINAVAWDATNGVYVAVADNGEICRSTNGIN